MRSGNIGGAVIPNKIGNLDRASSQILLILFVESLKRDRCKVSRRRQEFKSGARGPSFMKGMASL